jgi:hypothetical protein
MPSLRDCNYVTSPVNARALAQLAGIRGAVSLRELMVLLGSRGFGPASLYILGHNTNSIAVYTPRSIAAPTLSKWMSPPMSSISISSASTTPG